MFMYLCRKGPYDGRMHAGRRPSGFLLVDRPGAVNADGVPWIWKYDKEEVWVDDPGSPDENGQPTREFRGYNWICRDEAGEQYDPEKADHAANENDGWDLVAYDDGNVLESATGL